MDRALAVSAAKGGEGLFCRVDEAGHAALLLEGQTYRRNRGLPVVRRASQSEYWAPYQIVVDVTEGGGESFSIEAGHGVRFTVISCPLAEEKESHAQVAPAERTGRSRHRYSFSTSSAFGGLA
jgi:hypothetical protein